MNTALAIASIVLSLIAVATSSLLLVRQTLFMRHANEIPVSVGLYQEWRSAEFQTARDYIRKSLSSKCDPSTGLSALPDEARKSSNRIAALYSSLGALVTLGLVDERFAVSLLGDAAEADWSILEPFIFRQREISGDIYIYAFYEDFVCRIRMNYPVTKAYGLKFKKVSEGYPLLPRSASRRADEVNREESLGSSENPQ
jgi:hypothetical protein